MSTTFYAFKITARRLFFNLAVGSAHMAGCDVLRSGRLPVFGKCHGSILSVFFGVSSVARPISGKSES
jgi:hypothetical protein